MGDERVHPKRASFAPSGPVLVASGALGQQQNGVGAAPLTPLQQAMQQQQPKQRRSEAQQLPQQQPALSSGQQQQVPQPQQRQEGQQPEQQPQQHVLPQEVQPQPQQQQPEQHQQRHQKHVLLQEVQPRLQQQQLTNGGVPAPKSALEGKAEGLRREVYSIHGEQVSTAA